MTTARVAIEPPHASAHNTRLRRVVARHFDPEGGTPFWLERARRMNVDALTEIRTIEDLDPFGDMTPDDLRGRPLTDFLPRSLVDQRERLILGQTGGTTGSGVWTAYRDDEFHEAFVAPFLAAARAADFPTAGTWLYVGPSGPHIIGKVVRHLAAGLAAPDPFAVDFDPRWARVLPDESFARKRYIRHVVAQAMDVIERQPIDVLFTTPVLLDALADTMTGDQRERVRGVHYGGMALSGEALRGFQDQSFPNAVHLSGYGNTLFGCCLEFGGASDRALDYFPFGPRLILEVTDETGCTLPPGRTGRVRFTRLDESMLIIRMRERDEATAVGPPVDAPDGFGMPGLRDPHPVASEAPTTATGLY